MTRFVLALSLVLVPVLAVSAPPKKKGKGAPAKVLNIGDDVYFTLVGDEAKENPNTIKAGIIHADALVLPIQLNAISRSDSDQNNRLIIRYCDAANAGDRPGIDAMIESDQAVEVKKGTQMRVIFRSVHMNFKTMFKVLPADPGGCLLARVLDGPAKGKLVMVPLRNLTEVQPAAVKP